MKHFQNIIEVVLEHNTLIGKLHFMYQLYEYE